ncbi:MAG: hemolysin III family protein [Betaproteobacteria bacterium]|nr:hemolysin III family protein [Betaproteobacteria bacterium]
MSGRRPGVSQPEKNLVWQRRFAAVGVRAISQRTTACNCGRCATHASVKLTRQWPKNSCCRAVVANPGAQVHDHPLSDQSLREERANAASHLLGGLLALAAMPVLADQVDAARYPLRHLGLTVFITTMVLMYGVSAIYHALPAGRAKRALRRCDHALIFVFIAGSYTPFALGEVQRGQDWHPLAVVWAIALVGVALKLTDRLRHSVWSTGLYLLFGWMVALLARPVLAAMPEQGLQLLVAGGLAYSVGSLFFLLDGRMAYSHLVWHLWVIAGSSCHLLALQQTLA